MFQIAGRFAAFCVLLLVACQIEDAIDPGPDGTSNIAEGRVILPGGVSTPVDGLRVATNAAEAGVSADGSFAAPTATEDPSFAQIVTADGKLVMMGLLDPAGGQQHIDAKSTAASLLYIAGGLMLGSPDQYVDLYALASQSAACEALAAAIEAAIRTNLTALADGDDELRTALTAAVLTLQAESAAGPAASGLYLPAIMAINPMARSTSGVVLSSTSGVGGITLSPGPLAPQSGVTVLPGGQAGTVMARNAWRRTGAMYVYKTAVESHDGVRTEFNPPEFHAGPVPLPAAFQYTDVSSLFRIRGADSRTPSNSELAPLPRDAGAQATEYDVVVLGPTASPDANLGAVGEPQYVTLRGAWNAEVERLAWRNFMLTALWPLTETLVLGLPRLEDASDADPLVDALRTRVEPLLLAAGAAITSTANYSPAMEAYLTALRDDAVFRSGVADDIHTLFPSARMPLMLAGDLAARLRLLGSAEAIHDAVRTLFAAGDVAGVLADLAAARAGERWRAVVSGVRIEPEEAVVRTDRPSAVLRAIMEDSRSPVRYRWSTSGQNGYLFALTGEEGTSFSTTEAEVQYIATDAAAITNRVLDTVSVEVVFVNDEGQLASLGSATTTILGESDDEPTPDAGSLQILPNAFTLNEDQPGVLLRAQFAGVPPEGVEYRWRTQVVPGKGRLFDRQRFLEGGNNAGSSITTRGNEVYYVIQAGNLDDGPLEEVLCEARVWDTAAFQMVTIASGTALISGQRIRTVGPGVSSMSSFKVTTCCDGALPTYRFGAFSSCVWMNEDDLHHEFAVPYATVIRGETQVSLRRQITAQDSVPVGGHLVFRAWGTVLPVSVKVSVVAGSPEVEAVLGTITPPLLYEFFTNEFGLHIRCREQIRLDFGEWYTFNLSPWAGEVVKVRFTVTGHGGEPDGVSTRTSAVYLDDIQFVPD